MNKKKIFSIDFDGVIHSYTSGWSTADDIKDPPVPGAIEFLTYVVDEFDVNIFSTRNMQAGAIPAMKEWLLKYLTEYYEGVEDYANDTLSKIKFPLSKPLAFVGLDDRIILFEGAFPSLDRLKSFKPWNK
ncbi:MAG: hypothetical protein ACHQWH_02200 [Nitrososphaerales archaeon]